MCFLCNWLQSGYNKAAAGKNNCSCVWSVKSDVNLDGKVNVSDLVTAQKYLLNSLDKKETYTLDNFIAFDVCPDSRNDVFDMIAERRIVAETMADNK